MKNFVPPITSNETSREYLRISCKSQSSPDRVLFIPANLNSTVDGYASREGYEKLIPIKNTSICKYHCS